MLRAFASALALTLLVAPPLAAQSPADMVTMEVLPGWQTETGAYMAGIRFRLAPGWKTYWRAPGEAGIPPLFDFAGSENVAAAAFHWPVPEVFEQSGMQSIGYAGEVVIPVEITPSDASRPPHLAGVVDIGVCQEICVPVALDFAADLRGGQRREPAIASALVDRPLTAAEAGLSEVRCAVAATARGLQLTVSMQLPGAGGDEVVVVETADPAVWVSEARVAREGQGLRATVDLIHARGGAVALDRSTLRFTVLGRDHAVDIRGCAAA